MAVKHEELWLRWREQADQAARGRLAEEYLWLVRFVAGRLMTGLPAHYEQDDVEGTGCLGLLEAIDRYDPGRGVRFETFAIPWVRGACLQGVRAQQWFPALRKRVRRLEQDMGELEHRLGHEPSREELAEYMQLSLEQMDRRIAEVGLLSIISLQESLENEGGEAGTLQDRLADPDAVDPLISSYLEERRERLAMAIDSLPDQERMVVALFYKEELTAREIADLLSVSSARVSQVHSSAILRLRGKLARFKELMVS